MQIDVSNILVIIFGISIIVVTIICGYVVTIYYSHNRILKEQKNKYEELSRQEDKYRSLFEHSLAGMMNFNIDSFEISEANIALLSIFKCSSKTELQNCFKNLSAEDSLIVKSSLQDKNIVTECEINTKDYSANDIWILFSASVIPETKTAQGVVIDITYRKKFEERIEEQAALLNETQDAIIVINKDGIVLFWNYPATTMYGWDKTEVIGIPVKTVIYPKANEVQYLNILAEVNQNIEWIGEQKHYHKDGRQILIESHWKLITNSVTGKQVILIINTDITLKRKLEEHYLQSRKMELIALLTSGIAHDLQNVLAPVAMSVDLLREYVRSKIGREILTAVEESTHNGLSLVKNILTYGRGAKKSIVLVDIKSTIDSLQLGFIKTLPKNIRFKYINSLSNILIEGDEDLLKQVFLNLMVNGRDAMPDGGVLKFTVSLSTDNPPIAEEYKLSENENFVVISVEDSGIGISEENLLQIFDPFFTTKGIGAGTGLGLSIVQGVVKSHGGFITVRSKPGSGSLFQIYLPLVKKDVVVDGKK